MFHYIDVTFVWERKEEAVHPKTVYFGAGTKMLWDYLAAVDTGSLVWVHGDMKKEHYDHILNNNVKISVVSVAVGLVFSGGRITL